jgi:hypothetical protein
MKKYLAKKKDPALPSPTRDKTKNNLILNTKQGFLWLAGNGSNGPSSLSLVIDPWGHNVWIMSTTHPHF